MTDRVLAENYGRTRLYDSAEIRTIPRSRRYDFAVLSGSVPSRCTTDVR